MSDYDLKKVTATVNKVFFRLGLKKDEERASYYAEEVQMEKIPVNDSNVKKMFNYVKDNFNGYNYPPLDLFLEGLGIKSDKEIAEKIAVDAWNYISQLIDSWANNYSFGIYSKDKCLVYAINQIGVSTIRASVIGGMPNYINSYNLSKFEKIFKKSYADAWNNENFQTSNLIGSGAEAKKRGFLSIRYLPEKNKLLLESGQKLIGVKK